MKRKGIGAAFSDEDLELMRTLWLEEGRRETEAAKRSSRTKSRVKSNAVRSTPDRKTAPREKSLATRRSGGPQEGRSASGSEEATMTNDTGMRSIFTEEDIELMLAIRREAKAVTKSSRSKRSAKSQPVKTTPDPEAASSEAKPKC
jgi:hypothetical protein